MSKVETILVRIANESRDFRERRRRGTEEDNEKSVDDVISIGNLVDMMCSSDREPGTVFEDEKLAEQLKSFSGQQGAVPGQ
jgi:hypothetical protein